MQTIIPGRPPSPDVLAAIARASDSKPPAPPPPVVAIRAAPADVPTLSTSALDAEQVTERLMRAVFDADAVRHREAPAALARREIFLPHRPVVIGDASEHRLRAIANTADLDRYNTRILPAGLRPIKGPIPLLYSHDTRRPVGAIESIDADAERVEIEAHVSDEAVWQAMVRGEIAGVSIGFIAHQWHMDGDVTIITDWELVECSVVTTPANAAALVTELRSAEDMPGFSPPTRQAVRVITPPEQLPARQDIEPRGRVVHEISAARPLAAPALHQRGAPPHFSISSVIATRLAGAELRGVEGEICTELQRRAYAPTHGDVRIPAAVFQRRDLSTNPGSGAALSPEQWMQQLLDDVAAARRWGTLSPRLGFNILSTMREVIHVPKRMTVLEADVIAKDADAPSSDTTFGDDELGPKYISVTTTIRRSSVRYSDPSADAILTADIRRAMDDKIDDRLLFGNGVGLNIQGLLSQTPAALTINLAGAAIETPNLFDLKARMLNTWKLDDSLSALRWAANPALIDKLRTTSKKASAADEWFSGIMPFNSAEGTLLDMMLIQSGRLGVTAGGANQYDLHLIMGEMGIIAYFGGAAVDLLIDPYSLSVSGGVRLTAFVDVNAVARDLSIDSKIGNALAA